MGKNLINFLVKANFNIKKAFKYYGIYDKISDSNIFDEEFYVKTYDEVKGDPLTHYLFEGYKKNKLPSLDFDAGLYANLYGTKNENPLINYFSSTSDEKKTLIQSYPIREKNIIEDTNLAFLANYSFNEEPLVSIIILNRNGIAHLKRLFCDFDSKTNYSNYEIIVVDNDSSDGSVDYLKSLDLPIEIIENKENVSFSKGNNDAVKIANGNLILLLNNDIEPTYGWLNEMVGTMTYNENVGMVGAKLIFPFYPDDRKKTFSIQHVGDIFKERLGKYPIYPINKSSKELDIFDSSITKNTETIAVTGAAVLIDKEVYNELGGLDENYVYGLEDVDFCLKLYKNGYKTILSGNTLLFHHESSTRFKSKDYVRNHDRNYEIFENKWAKFLSKNFVLDKIDNKKFFTESKLKITIIDENNESTLEIAKTFNEMGYLVEIIRDLENYYIGNSDILLSFSTNYDIERIIAREDTVKVLVGNENFDNYDVLVVDNQDDFNKFKDKVNNLLLIEEDFSKNFIGAFKKMLIYSKE